MSSRIPEEPDIDAWLSGQLSSEESLAFESQLEEIEPSLAAEQDDSADEWSGFQPVSHSPEVTGLVEIVKTQSGALEFLSPQHECWQEFVDPGDGSPEMLGRLGVYELVEVIAIGGMGIVFKAWDPDLKRHAALKMIAPGLIGNSRACERFLREARAAAKLEHENILPIYGVYHEPVPYFAMKFAAGGTLEERIHREGSPGFEQTRLIALQIASALHAAHAEGIVHRDIKPANVLFDGEGEHLRVCDFGIARSVEDPGLTYAGVITGTPRYMSPEQASGGKTDERCDLFSLGAVLYFCATAKAPFDGDTTISVLQNVSASNDVTLRKREYPSWFRRLIENLLSKNPDNRPATAKAVIELIELGTSPKSVREKRSRRRVILGLGAVGIASFSVAQVWKRRDTILPGYATDNFDPHQPPRISIRETGEEFASFESLFEVVTDGAVIELEGRLVCDRQYDGPEGMSLQFVAGKGGATVVASHSQYALYMQGATSFRNIRFLRENWTGPLKPILGVAAAGGHARLENCLFRSRPPSHEEFGGDGVAIIDCAHAEIVECKFDMPSGTSILLVGNNAGEAGMRTDVSRCVSVSQIAIFRRNVSEVSNQMLHCSDSVFLTDYFMVDSYRNPFFPWSATFRGCLVDCGNAVYFDADFEKEVFEKGNRWESRESVFRKDIPFLVTNGGNDKVPPVPDQVTLCRTLEDFLAPLSDSRSVDDRVGLPLNRKRWENSGRRIEDIQKFVSSELEDFMERTLRILPESQK